MGLPPWEPIPVVWRPYLLSIAPTPSWGLTEFGCCVQKPVGLRICTDSWICLPGSKFESYSTHVCVYSVYVSKSRLSNTVSLCMCSGYTLQYYPHSVCGILVKSTSHTPVVVAKRMEGLVITRQAFYHWAKFQLHTVLIPELTSKHCIRRVCPRESLCVLSSPLQSASHLSLFALVYFWLCHILIFL